MRSNHRKSLEFSGPDYSHLKLFINEPQMQSPIIISPKFTLRLRQAMENQSTDIALQFVCVHCLFLAIPEIDCS